MIEVVRFCLVLTVAAIPVALPAVLTLTMVVGAINLARRKAVISRLAAIDELAGVSVLCSDKTGTLTQNKMTVSDPILFDKNSSDDLMIYSALASKEENNDPIEIPVFEFLKKNNLYDKLKDYKQSKFKPFDPVSKRTEAEITKKGRR